MNLPGKTKQRTSIEQIRENDFEAISEYYTTGSSTALTEQQQRILERLRTAHAVMRKYPRKSVAALKLQARFPEISREQAYCDIRNACRLWNKYDPVDRDFLEGWTPSEIARHLNAAGVPGVHGKAKWHAITIERMLQNEKHVGDLLMQKTYTADFLTKRQTKNQGELEQYYIRDNL